MQSALKRLVPATGLFDVILKRINSFVFTSQLIWFMFTGRHEEVELQKWDQNKGLCENK